MKTVRPILSIAAAFVAFHLSACSDVKITHVPPGKSARAVLAQNGKPQGPAAGPDMSDLKPRSVAMPGPGQLPPESLPPLPSGQVNIPSANGTEGGIADTYSRGTFAMQAGQNAEAISALEQTVKLDPDFTDAWGKLAILYQKNGDSTKATEAFKKAKRLGDANGGTVSRDTISGLQLQ
jgi:Tetratricopeptide repeat